MLPQISLADPPPAHARTRTHQANNPEATCTADGELSQLCSSRLGALRGDKAKRIDLCLDKGHAVKPELGSVCTLSHVRLG